MKKSLIHIIVANLFYMLIVASTNFILPKFVSIDTYATVKEYTLYITTYSSILTLGYIQGMYLKYGGKEIKTLDPKEVGNNVISFFVFMFPISLIVSLIGVIIKNPIITVVGAGIFATNIQNYYQMLYQATGDFKSYGAALNYSRIMIFITYIILIFIFKTDSKLLYILVGPIVGIIVSVYLTIKLNKKIPILKNAKVSLLEIKNSIKSGFILMLGNFVTKFFSTIDRWFIKIIMGTFEFAMYSFAVSMENIVNTFMTPITVSMYNYFCKKPDNKEILKIKNATLIYSFVIIAMAFPAKWILENFMNEYISSTVVIFPLFAAQGISTIIKGVYINKYKAENKQKKYLMEMIMMLALAIVLNIIFYAIIKNMAAIAMATLVTNLIWLTKNEIENKSIRYDKKSIISIIILLIVYIYSGYRFNSILGCILYCTTGLILGVTLMKDTFLYVISSVLAMLKLKILKK